MNASLVANANLREKGGRGATSLFLNSVAVRHFRIEINRCRFRNICVQIVSPARVGKSLQYATPSDFNVLRSTRQHHWATKQHSPIDSALFWLGHRSTLIAIWSRTHPRDLFSLPQARSKLYQTLHRDDTGVLMWCQVKVRFRESPPSFIPLIFLSDYSSPLVLATTPPDPRWDGSFWPSRIPRLSFRSR